jgi:hypothetical protein
VRKIVYDLLVAWTALPVFERSSLIDSAPATPPFVIYTLTSETPDATGPATATLEVWVYDTLGSYALIDQILRDLRLMFAAVPETSRTRADATVVKLVQADWIGSSPDLNDDVFRCTTRNATWRLIGKGQ